MEGFFFPNHPTLKKKKKKRERKRWSPSSCLWPCYFLSLDGSFMAWWAPPGGTIISGWWKVPITVIFVKVSKDFFLIRSFINWTKKVFSHWKYIQHQYPTTIALKPSFWSPLQQDFFLFIPVKESIMRDDKEALTKSKSTQPCGFRRRGWGGRWSDS